MKNLEIIKKELDVLRKLVGSSEVDSELTDEFYLLLGNVTKEIIDLKSDVDFLLIIDDSAHEELRARYLSYSGGSGDNEEDSREGIEALKKENEELKKKFKSISKEIKEIEKVLKKNKLL
jgi:hypothetical protein